MGREETVHSVLWTALDKAVKSHVIFILVQSLGEIKLNKSRRIICTSRRSPTARMQNKKPYCETGKT